MSKNNSTTVYQVKLDKWASPTTIICDDALTAAKKALKYYPTCDCCDEKTHVEWVILAKHKLVEKVA